MNFQRFFFTFCLLFLAGMGAFSSPEIDVKVGYGNYHKAGEWTPVHVTISNVAKDGQDPSKLSDFIGSAEVVTQDINGNRIKARRLVNLPASSRKSLFLYTKFPETEKEAVVRLIFPNGNIFRSILLDDSPNNGPKPISIDPPDIKAIKRIGETVGEKLVVIVDGASDIEPFRIPPHQQNYPVRDVRIAPDEVPDKWYGLESVDLLVLERGDQLNDEQLQAVYKWVQMGGKLLALGGNASRSYIDANIEPMLPVDVLGISDYKFDSERHPIKTLADVKVKDNARVLTQTTSSDGYTLPLTVMHKVGRGEVHYWTFRHPLASKDLSLLQSVLRQDTDELFLRSWKYELPAYLTPSGLLGVKGQPPSVFVILFIIGLYCLIVGPLNFRYLYKRQKLELAWLTIPAIVLVFSLGMYLVGVLTMGNTYHHHEAHLILGDLNQPNFKQHSYSSLFSARPGKLDVKIIRDAEVLMPVPENGTWVTPGNATVGGLLDEQYYQLDHTFFGSRGGGLSSTFGLNSLMAETSSSDEQVISQSFEPHFINEMNFRQWSWQTVESMGAAPLGNENSMLTGEVVWGSRGRLEGWLQNTTAHTIKDARIRIHLPDPTNRQPTAFVYSFGDMAPGQRVQIENANSITQDTMPSSIVERNAEFVRNNNNALGSNISSQSEAFGALTNNMIRRLETIIEFPRGKAFFYGYLERPDYRALIFPERGALLESHSLMVVNLPLKLRSYVSLPKGLLTTIPISNAPAQTNKKPPMYKEDGLFYMGDGRTNFMIESIFEPGTAFCPTINIGVNSINRPRSTSSVYNIVIDFVMRFQNHTVGKLDGTPSFLGNDNILSGRDALPLYSQMGLIRLEGVLQNPDVNGNRATLESNYERYSLVLRLPKVGGDFNPPE
jgi:hypothetical protein